MYYHRPDLRPFDESRFGLPTFDVESVGNLGQIGLAFYHQLAINVVPENYNENLQGKGFSRDIITLGDAA